MSIVDIVIIAIFALFGLWGFRRGFMSELLGITGWVIGFLLALKYGNLVASIIDEKFIFLQTISSFVAGVLILIAVRFVMWFIFEMVGRFLAGSIFGLVDKILGVLWRLFVGVLLVTVVFLVIEAVPVNKTIKSIEKDSKTIPYLKKVTFAVSDAVTEFIPQTRVAVDKLMDRVKKSDNPLYENSRDFLDNASEKLKDLPDEEQLRERYEQIEKKAREVRR